MKSYQIAISIVTCIMLIYISCTEKESFSSQWRQSANSNRLILDSFKNGDLICRTTFLPDSINKVGERIYYYSNGLVKKWMWFDHNKEDSLSSKFPVAIYFFSQEGIFEHFKGTPLLRTEYSRFNQLYVDLSKHPPNLEVVIGLRDSLRGSEIASCAFSPVVTDTSCWYAFSNIDFDTTHRYWLEYQIINIEQDTLLFRYKERIDLYGSSIRIVVTKEYTAVGDVLPQAYNQLF